MSESVETRMNLFELFIRRPVLTLMLNLALLVFGLMGLSRLPVRELPDIDPPVVNVLTVYPGASAEVVETEVTEVLEEQISSIEGIKLLTSESREQASSISVEFIQKRDIELAAQDVRDRVSRVRGDLPDDINEPVIAKQDAAAQPIMWVAFFSDRYTTEQLTDIAENRIKDRLQTIDGVSSVIVGGAKEFAVRIWLDPLKMAAHGVTALDVEQAISRENLELPAGRVEGVNRELNILTKGQFTSSEPFNRLVIRQEGTRIIRLEDIGRAEDGVEDERAVARFRSKPAVGLGIVRQSKANTVAVASKVKEVMAELGPTLPEDIEVAFPYDESIYVSQAVLEVWETLFLASILVVLVIFLFLRNVRSTLVPAIAIPFSLGTTFGVLYLMGFSINIFTLLALVLAIGIVVDDTIVVLENIYRHLEMGEPPLQAAVLAMREISFAVIVTTVTLISIFIPLVFVGGLTGRLLLEFSISIAAAVAVSSVVALTMAPMVGSRILRPIKDSDHGRVFNFLERRFEHLNQRYDKWLNRALHHRWAVILIATISFGLSAYFFLMLDREFLPQEDKGRLLSIAIAPEGSTPEYTDRMMQQIEKIVETNPYVEGYFTAVAIPFNGPGNPAQGFMFIRLTDGDRPNVRDMVGGPMGLGARFITESEGIIAFPIMPKAVDVDFSQPYRLVLSAENLEELNQVAQDTVNQLREKGFLANIRSSFELNKPELEVDIDRDRASALGVSVLEISRTLQLLFAGFDVSEVKVAGKQYEVITQLERPNRMQPSDLAKVYVRSASGTLIPLNNLVQTRTAAGPNVIERFNRRRSATIEATPVGVTLGFAVDQTEAMLSESLPPGFSYDWRGEARNLNESSSDLYLFMLLAIVVVYMVLAAQFESLIHPFVVMMALPLAFVGAFGLLYALSWVNSIGSGLYGWTHYAPEAPAWAHTLSRFVPRIPSMNMNVFSQVGLILLVGLVTKNSILIVEFANQLREKGLSARDAVYQAAKIRFRPILMTSLSTIAGILPIAIGFGEAAESRRPLGVVAVGGLISSTLLTLFVIPVMYSLLTRNKRKEDRFDQPA